MFIEVDGKQYNTDQLLLLGSGGEADVYKVPHPKNPDEYLALKIFHGEISDAIWQRLQSIVQKCHLYHGLELVSAVPQEFGVFTPLARGGKVRAGFTMRLLGDDFILVSNLADLNYCIQNKITLRRVGVVFEAIHRALNQIHEKYYRIGDLRGSNIQFQKSANQNVEVVFMDVDSWAGRFNGNCSAILEDIRHPRLTDITQLQPYHDWYAFAHQFATCLLKCNPFEKGFHPNLSSTERKTQGITCWDNSVELSVESKQHDFRFGPRLIDALKLWLKGNQTGVFPIEVIHDFLRSLTFCEFCKLELSKELAVCTRCRKTRSPRHLGGGVNVHTK